jgi:formiminotetrahydrofolate cyclodeaminase
VKFADHTLDRFSRLVASEHPTPGGGSSAAVSGALGISLLGMVSSISGKKYPARKPDMERISADSEALRRRFLALADEDSAAYGRIMKTFSLSPPSAEESQNALKAASELPLAILGAALEGLSLAKALAAGYYAPTASDAGLAAQLLRSAALGAELTVLINLPHITDRAFTARCKEESRAMAEQAAQFAEEVYRAVRERLSAKAGAGGQD